MSSSSTIESQKKKSFVSTLIRSSIAGGITGGIEICITYPTEFVKTQLQLDQKLGAERRYTGIFDCVRKTFKQNGVFGLYRGLPVLIYGSVPKSGVRFAGFEELKRNLSNENGTLTKTNAALCGLGAGVAEAIFAVTPMETVKVKFIDDRNRAQPRFRGFFHGLRTIVAEEGVSGLYKGLSATILKQGSNQAIRFTTVESLKNWYRGDDEKKAIPKLTVGVFGGIAGFCSVIGNTPVDVIKSRMQGLEAKKYRNTWHCFVMTWQEEGLKGFYKGTMPRMGRVVLDVAITFMIYESIRDLFNSYWPPN